MFFVIRSGVKVSLKWLCNGLLFANIMILPMLGAMFRYVYVLLNSTTKTTAMRKEQINKSICLQGCGYVCTSSAIQCVHIFVPVSNLDQLSG